MKEWEWKKFRKLNEKCLERFCDAVLQDAENICRSDEKTAHERYLDLYELLRIKDNELANAFDGMRRSTASIQLLQLYRMGLVEESQLDEFEDETRNRIRELTNVEKP
jgi:DNA-binding transcriptional ArsR family regulator